MSNEGETWGHVADQALCPRPAYAQGLSSLGRNPLLGGKGTEPGQRRFWPEKTADNWRKNPELLEEFIRSVGG